MHAERICIFVLVSAAAEGHFITDGLTQSGLAEFSYDLVGGGTEFCC